MFTHIFFGNPPLFQLSAQATDTYDGCTHLTARSGLVREIQSQMLAFEAFVNVSVVVVLQPFSKIIDSDFVILDSRLHLVIIPVI